MLFSHIQVSTGLHDTKGRMMERGWKNNRRTPQKTPPQRGRRADKLDRAVLSRQGRRATSHRARVGCIVCVVLVTVNTSSELPRHYHTPSILLAFTSEFYSLIMMIRATSRPFPHLSSCYKYIYTYLAKLARQAAHPATRFIHAHAILAKDY